MTPADEERLIDILVELEVNIGQPVNRVFISREEADHNNDDAELIEWYRVRGIAAKIIEPDGTLT